MKKKIFGLALSTMLFALSFSAEAQQAKKVPRIGVLTTGSEQLLYTEAFRQGLRELGYVEGKNITIEYRRAQGINDRLPNLALELVRLKVDIIVTSGGSAAVLAAKNATKTIPIVMVTGSDPVGTGLVASLARPGENITGLSVGGPALYGKRLELLKETVPKISRVGVLRNPTHPASALDLKEIQTAAHALGLQLQSLELRTPDDIEGAFEAATEAQAQALLVTNESPISLSAGGKRIVDLVAKSRLPAMYADREWPNAGGLMSYGANNVDLFSRAAIFVDKILKGAKPGDLPIEQPMKFELAINLKAAKQIGLTIPPNVLARADRVIR